MIPIDPSCKPVKKTVRSNFWSKQNEGRGASRRGYLIYEIKSPIFYYITYLISKVGEPLGAVELAGRYYYYDYYY